MIILERTSGISPDLTWKRWRKHIERMEGYEKRNERWGLVFSFVKMIQHSFQKENTHKYPDRYFMCFTDSWAYVFNDTFTSAVVHLVVTDYFLVANQTPASTLLVIVMLSLHRTKTAVPKTQYSFLSVLYVRWNSLYFLHQLFKDFVL